MRNYKDLLVWEKAHKLTLAVYKITQTLPRKSASGLRVRFGERPLSIAANLAEGCGRRSDGEMVRYIQIAMGSGAELSYHFLLTRDLGFMSSAEYESLSSDLSEIMRMLSALSGRLKSPTRPGVLELRAKG